MPPHRSPIKTKAITEDQLSRVIAARVREERRRRGLTQERLAELTDLSANYIAHVERASRGVSMGTLVVLAKVLEVPAHTLLVPSAWSARPAGAGPGKSSRRRPLPRSRT